MNRFEKENAVEKINGYFSKRPHENDDVAAFERAQKETVKHMTAALENVKEITFKDFAADRHTMVRLDA